MIPPAGFKSEVYPLRHRVIYSFGLNAKGDTLNTALCTIVMHSTDVDIAASAIEVNPHNTNYDEETGPLVQKMSILDKLRISIRFNMTNLCNDLSLTSGTAGPNFDDGVYSGDGIKHIKFLWRPIFFSFPEKLQAADDDTGNTVETILALTSDDTNEDVVPLTTTKLPTAGESDKSQPISNINAVQVAADYNMTTDLTMEDHVWDEDLFQNALRRFTNKGALKACVGRTRHVNLTQDRPYKSFYLDKFLPRSIRRVVDRTYLGIQVHIPIASQIDQDYFAQTLTGSKAHIGCKIIANYHEWNADHFQEMSGTGV